MVQGFEKPTTLQSLAVRWTWLTILVFAGSAWYGGSVAHALGITFDRGALWLIASTGLSWCIFGPLLMAVTRKDAIACADACLVTMAVGVAVLAVGGLVNVAAAGTSGFSVAAFNWVWVGLSNVVMAFVIVRRFSLLSVAWYRTLAVWIVGLDGVGALIFWLFRHLISAT